MGIGVENPVRLAIHRVAVPRDPRPLHPSNLQL
jgi:hypothetical protein